MTASVVEEIRRVLRELADPAIAPGQQAYMKSAMPFLGVRVPEVRRSVRAVLARHPASPEELLRVASTLWDDADYREERYAALAVVGARLLRGDPAIVPLIEHFTRTGRWWDITDDLAHRMADLLDAHPTRMGALVRRWTADDEMWIQRLAILSQLGRRKRVDLALLSDAITPHVADREFFIRKAIGWALRDVARDEPRWVRDFVDSHPLSPLSRREALKHLGGASSGSADELAQQQRIDLGVRPRADEHVEVSVPGQDVQ